MRQKHVFINYARSVNMEQRLGVGLFMREALKKDKGSWINKFLHMMRKDATDPNVIFSVDPLADDAEWSPVFFGAAFEWLAAHYLEHYASHYNLTNMSMTDAIGSTARDYGVDMQAESVKLQKLPNGMAHPGSPVFIQAKGTTDKEKIYKTNDGSHIANFMMYAQARAAQMRQSYKARYILIHAGKDTHWMLNAQAGGLIEGINIDEMEEKTRGDISFLNKLRADLGLSPVTNYNPPSDEEYGEAMSIDDDADLFERAA